jgi:hypothetical protein
MNTLVQKYVYPAVFTPAYRRLAQAADGIPIEAR